MLFKRFQFALKNLIRPNNLLIKLKNFYKKTNIRKLLNSFPQLGNFEGKILNIEHHLSHIASAFYQSGYDNACGVSIDGSGDFTTTSNATCLKNDIKINHRILYPHSLGILYSAITNYLGFNKYGDEYKVMGMAAYGNNNLNEKIKKIILFDNNGIFKLNLNYFVHHKNFNTYKIDGNNKIILNSLLNENEFYDLLKVKKRNPNDELRQEHFDLAFALQNLYEDAFIKYLNFSMNNFGSENLCLAGGCAMNSLANGKIREKTNFKKIFIQPASYDAGGALGAALYVSAKKENKNINKTYFNFYFGDKYKNEYITELLLKKNFFNNNNFVVENFKNKNDHLIKLLVSILSQKKIVAIFRGRMEWGARALGNRSILADPRGFEIKDILNKKIKKRESFRPFAPIILQDHVKSWFNIDFEVPTMMEVHKINIEKKNIVPSIVHKDQTCRLQTLTKKNNKFIYNLISLFNEINNVPMLLNTSFNENEPIVATPEHALDTFLRTGIDALLLEDILIRRN